MSLFQSKKHLETCPECHSALQIKRSKKGLFLGCSAYPDCQYIKYLQSHQFNIIKNLDESCPECKHLLQLKQGNYGIFIGCSNYPECEFTVHEERESEEEFDCPECRKNKLIARQGRQGKLFYGCTGYPQCKFTLPSKPIAKQCPQCKGAFVITKNTRKVTAYLCINPSCQHLFTEEA